MEVELTKHAMDFIEMLNNGYNPEFKPLKVTIMAIQKMLNEMREKGIYTSEYILKRKQELIDQLLEEKDKILQEMVDKFESKIQEIKDKYIVASLSDSEVNMKLLEIKRFENKLKFLNQDGLQIMVNEFGNGNNDMDLDSLHMLGAELRNRGYDGLCETLTQMIEERHFDDPWMNEPDYPVLIEKITEINSDINRPHITIQLTKEDGSNRLKSLYNINNLIA